MDETVIFPSPNWFQASVIAISHDGWLIYGGPIKSLCILEPLHSEHDGVFKHNQSYRAHVMNKAHLEKITSVDISKEWPEKKLVLTGSADGCVKQWNLEHFKNSIRLKSTLSHEIHYNDKEDVAGLGYSTDVFAITVGGYGNIVKWDLKSNVVKTYNQFLKSFKPTCVACSQHTPLNVAVGTKQGVVFVLDLNGNGKIVYKVRGQDDEIINLSWCPQYEVILKKTLKESQNRTHLESKLDKLKLKDAEEDLNDSGISKNLPEDSFDESIAQEDDMFDIYKDHEADEFGHKKFQPTDIIVKLKKETPSGDFLAECLKLKEAIINKKNDKESSIATLVDALDKTHVDSNDCGENKTDVNEIQTDGDDLHKTDNAGEVTEETQSKNMEECSSHLHKHLLATIGKYGGVRLWSKSGKLVGSCVVPNAVNKNHRSKGPIATTLLWYKPDVLLIADGKSQLLECNPMKIDCRNKLDWQIVHSLHKRGLYAIATNAPRVQTENSNGSDDWLVWTIAQDRNIVCYSMERKEKISVHNTCGGFVYSIQHCPYDAKKIAVSVGDGAVRIWNTDTLVEDDSKLSMGHVTSYWQNVQGKVLTVAWHPTKENLLAFGTAEARVGLIDTSGKTERPARTLLPVLQGGVYSLCWGRNDQLYACGGGKLVVYNTDAIDKDPMPIKVQFEGKQWELSSVLFHSRGLVCGGVNGALAVLDPDTNEILTASFIFGKMIYTTEWHPQQTSTSSEDSIYRDLIAVSSLDKACSIIIVEYNDKGDGPKIHPFKTLSGHTATVLQLSWNPHNDVQLLSTSHDTTVRIWDISSGECTHIFGGHCHASLSACWSSFPSLSNVVMSSGSDCCLRLWQVDRHTTDVYTDMFRKMAPGGAKKTKTKKAEIQELEKGEEQVATTFDTKASTKAPKKFLLPIISKQISPCTVYSVRQMLVKYWSDRNGTNEKVANGQPDVVEENVEGKEAEEKIVEFTKIFGTTNDLNEVLDMEMARHSTCNRWESCVVLNVLRGQMSDMVTSAAARGELCPFIVSLAPTVSHKFWKDATQMYLAQIDRMIAKGEEEKLSENKQYGGAIYRKACLQLCSHDVRAAVHTLVDARLFKEAYILGRVRHMDSIAEDTLKKWATDCLQTGNICMAAVCYLALGDPYQAALALSKSDDQELLGIASELAKESGQATFANHIEDKKTQILSETSENDEQLKKLPTKIDLLIDSVGTSEVTSDVI
ncbi:putative gemin 5 [Danaus plexippus plexippus]|uniref:Gemin 5 n=1 Tax=Danaus plexippus plexippus TaxID=278856 RepID=A0A212EKL3_DANPL|nr:putative gemin 5 [Danaus plexippus plexippus]